MTAEPVAAPAATRPEPAQSWWESLRHFGLLLGPSQVVRLETQPLAPLPDFRAHQLRRELARFEAKDIDEGALVAWVLGTICGLKDHVTGRWARGNDVPQEWRHPLVAGESLKPRHLWVGPHDAALPVFFATRSSHRLGLYRGRKTVSDVVQWLRAAGRPVALLTNGRQLRLLYAGLDFHSACEWDFEALFEAGRPGPQLEALRRLLAPAMLTPPSDGAESPLVEAIHASRRGQSELSAELGERVRDAVEILVRGHGPALGDSDLRHNGQALYRAAIRVVMRMVFLFFAESRDLLPRTDPVYTQAYSLRGLFETLGRQGAQGEGRLRNRFAAWPRVLALFRLVHEGSHHEALEVPAYGGDLFAPGEPQSDEPWRRALHLFETACFDSRHQLMSDLTVHRVLERLARARVRIRQGRASTWTTVPVDFSDLSSEYIGILYEGLLDYELRQPPPDDPVIFLAVGDEPALSLSDLENMEPKQIQDLFKNLQDKSGKSGDNKETAEEELEDQDADGEEADEGEEDHAPTAAAEEDEDTDAVAVREAARVRARQWTRKACEIARLVKRPRGRLTAEKSRAYEEEIDRKAERMVRNLFLPGDWYLVRWGGTRKGAGTYYTRPQLAVPLVHRTLRPLAYDPPIGEHGSPDRGAPAEAWTPKAPEALLDLKVCDPACGSGTFPLAALRFLTDALYASLFHHGRLDEVHDQTLVHLLGQRSEDRKDRLSDERIPCLPNAEDFQPRLEAKLRRHVVERCIYGVDIDPIAVELCKLALWIETMDRDLPFTFLDHKVKVGNSLVGCWFDRFQHYPPMAWKRDAGDSKHANGVHFAKEELTKAIKARCGNTNIQDAATVRKDLLHLLEEAASGQLTLFTAADVEKAAGTHDGALETLRQLHDLPAHEAEERARRYRDEVLKSPEWTALQNRFDLWCALWFWPADDLGAAPLPTVFLNPGTEVLEKARAVSAAQGGFFHWELEFPDVFDHPGSGFDAVTGNPPWEISKPNSKEFFSQFDPLYRSYGKEEAVDCQTRYFREDPSLEERWIGYNAGYRAMSNWVKYSAHAFGDVAKEDSDNFALALGKKNKKLHRFWAELRRRTTGYADPDHPYRHQGSADLNLYKLFLEIAHAILQNGGRLGFLVPSGIYSDQGTGDLRRLFLEDCRWEWLFGFENREKIFDIDSRFKFNPVIVEKGGTTEEVQTAFMHRRLEDWSEAEEHAVPYSQKQVHRFSPKSRAILEIQSERDLEILETIYSNSVLLGDMGPDGWGIEYATEFHMTSDSKLFPPRPVWEEKGYRPDEYSRWLLGDWQPRNPTSPAPPGAKRVEIPEGIILSRDGDSWIHEERVDDVALPLYEGRMVGQFDFSQKGWVRGKGRGAIWRDVPFACKEINPQYCMGISRYRGATNRAGNPKALRGLKVAFMDITSSTNERTMIAALVSDAPCGNSAPVLKVRRLPEALTAILNSFGYDFVIRRRCAGLHLNYFVIEESPLTREAEVLKLLGELSCSLSAVSPLFAPTWTRNRSRRAAWRRMWALTPHERLRLRCMVDALSFEALGYSTEAAAIALEGCDLPARTRVLSAEENAKGFWRIDRDSEPELRHTVLSLVAFLDLQQTIKAHNGDRKKAALAFCTGNGSDGWMLPGTLRLADYGLGHDDRADRPQPVASRLGPRFYDWQLTQDAEESWRECELHARNLLGRESLKELLREPTGGSASRATAENGEAIPAGSQHRLFPGNRTLFDEGMIDPPPKGRR